MSVKLLTEHYLEFLSLKGGCSGSSESTLVKMPHCWKSHVVAHNVSSAVLKYNPIFRPSDRYTFAPPSGGISQTMIIIKPNVLQSK